MDVRPFITETDEDDDIGGRWLDLMDSLRQPITTRVPRRSEYDGTDGAGIAWHGRSVK